MNNNVVYNAPPPSRFGFITRLSAKVKIGLCVYCICMLCTCYIMCGLPNPLGAFDKNKKCNTLNKFYLCISCLCCLCMIAKVMGYV